MLNNVAAVVAAEDCSLQIALSNLQGLNGILDVADLAVLDNVNTALKGSHKVGLESQSEGSTHCGVLVAQPATAG